MFQTFLDEIDVLLGRRDASLRLLLEGVKDIDRVSESDRVDRPACISVKSFGKELKSPFEDERATGLLLAEDCFPILRRMKNPHDFHAVHDDAVVDEVLREIWNRPDAKVLQAWVQFRTR